MKGNGNGKTTVAQDVSGLGGGSLNLSMPAQSKPGNLPLKRFDFRKLPKISKLPGAESVRQEIAEAKSFLAGKEFREWVNTTLEQIDARKSIEAQGSEVWTKYQEEHEAELSALKEAEMALRGYLNDPDAVVRCGTAKLVLARQFSTSTPSIRSLVGRMNQMLADGLLLEQFGENGSFRIGKLSWNAAPGLCLGGQDITDLASLLERTRRETLAKTSAEQAIATKELYEASNATIEQLMDGKQGVCAMFVPPHEIRNIDQRVSWPSGSLQVGSDGKKICPMAATGSISRAVELMQDSRTFIYSETLAKEGLKQKDFPHYWPWYLYRLIWLAIENQKKEKEIADIRGEMLRQAKDSCDEDGHPDIFDFVGGQDGTFFLEYRGREPWAWIKGESRIVVRHPFFLAQREEGKIRFLGISPTVEAFIKEHIDPNFDLAGAEYVEGQAFAGVANSFLQALLRAIWKGISIAASRARESNDTKKEPVEEPAAE